MKRFTETTKWRDPWFRRLSPPAKLLWLYIIDNCSCIGLIDVDYDAIKFDMGYPIMEKHMAELGDRVKALDSGKYFVSKFIAFQYGDLSECCPAHKPVFKAIQQYCLQYPADTLAIGYRYPSDRVQDKEKEKKRKEGVQGESEKRSTIGNSTVIPIELDDASFRSVWEKWLGHLKQKRKPPSLHAQDLQLRRLALLGPAKAIATINHCIEHNWQGIYEPSKSDSRLKHNPRNDGIANGPTDYGEAAKRKLERQALEAKHRAASEAQGA